MVSTDLSSIASGRSEVLLAAGDIGAAMKGLGILCGTKPSEYGIRIEPFRQISQKRIAKLGQLTPCRTFPAHQASRPSFSISNSLDA